MKIATFNVNGIKTRLPHLLQWLEREKPDVKFSTFVKSLHVKQDVNAELTARVTAEGIASFEAAVDAVAEGQWAKALEALDTAASTSAASTGETASGRTPR